MIDLIDHIDLIDLIDLIDHIDLVDVINPIDDIFREKAAISSTIKNKIRKRFSVEINTFLIYSLRFKVTRTAIIQYL